MLATYHHRVHESGPVVRLFKQSEHKGYGGGTKQYQDQLILELLENKLPERRGRFFWERCAGCQYNFLGRGTWAYNCSHNAFSLLQLAQTIGRLLQQH